MSEYNENEESVARHYDQAVFQEELNRLTRDYPVEFRMTCRWLERFVRPEWQAVEIGVGGACYTEFLARKGCRLHLVDVSARLLENALNRLKQAGLASQILGAHHASARHLDPLPAECVDVVLLMGPLYHLIKVEDRHCAVSEARRVLKSGGLLIAAGINKLAYLRDQFRENPSRVAAREAFHRAYLRDGNLDPEHAPPVGYAHLTGVAEFRELFEEGFEQVALVGVESFLTAWQKGLNELPDAEAQMWLDLVEETGQTAEGLGQSDHFLYAGRKLP